VKAIYSHRPGKVVIVRRDASGRVVRSAPQVVKITKPPPGTRNTRGR
jgi:hypothetical protein